MQYLQLSSGQGVSAAAGPLACVRAARRRTLAGVAAARPRCQVGSPRPVDRRWIDRLASRQASESDLIHIEKCFFPGAMKATVAAVLLGALPVAATSFAGPAAGHTMEQVCGCTHNIHQGIRSSSSAIPAHAAARQPISYTFTPPPPPSLANPPTPY